MHVHIYITNMCVYMCIYIYIYSFSTGYLAFWGQAAGQDLALQGSCFQDTGTPQKSESVTSRQGKC